MGKQSEGKVFRSVRSLRIEEEYRKMERLAYQAEMATGLYLWDECVDRENAKDSGHDEHSDEFWAIMLESGRSMFGSRCEDHGLDANSFGINY